MPDCKENVNNIVTGEDHVYRKRNHQRVKLLRWAVQYSQAKSQARRKLKKAAKASPGRF